MSRTKPRWERIVSWLVVPIVAMAGILIASPAQAYYYTYSGKLVFDKSARTLSLQIVKYTWVDESQNDFAQNPVNAFYKTYPASSGYFANQNNTAANSTLLTTNACANSRGPLPNGVYDVMAKTNHGGASVGSWVFQLTDKACTQNEYNACMALPSAQRPLGCKLPPNQKRNELFIHTTIRNGAESTANHTYSSEGCIKLYPTDLHEAISKWDQYFNLGQWYTGRLVVQD